MAVPHPLPRCRLLLRRRVPWSRALALIALLLCSGETPSTRAQSIPSLNGCACDTSCFFGGGVFIGQRRWCWVIESTCAAGVPYRAADGRGWDLCPNSASSTMYSGPTLSAVTATAPPRSTMPRSVGTTTPSASPTPAQAASTMLAADAAVVASDDTQHTIQIVGICAGVAGALVAVAFVVGGTMWAKKERRKSVVRDVARDDVTRVSSSRFSFETRPATSTPSILSPTARSTPSLLSPTPGSTPSLLSPPTPLPMASAPDTMLYSRIASPTPTRATALSPTIPMYPGASASAPTPPIGRDMTPTPPPFTHSLSPTSAPAFLQNLDSTHMAPDDDNDDDDGIVVPPRTGSLDFARRVMRASLDERRDAASTTVSLALPLPPVRVTRPSLTPPVSRVPTPTSQIIQEATPVDDATVVPPRTGSLALARRGVRMSLDEWPDVVPVPPVRFTRPSRQPRTPPVSREPTPTPTATPSTMLDTTPATTEDEADTSIPPRTGSLVLSRRIMRASLDERRDFLVTPTPAVLSAMRAAAATPPALDGVSIQVGGVKGFGAVTY